MTGAVGFSWEKKILWVHMSRHIFKTAAGRVAQHERGELGNQRRQRQPTICAQQTEKNKTQK